MSTFAPATTFASSLRGWREHQRVSQLELALRAGTTQRHISFIERGRSLPGRGMIVRLTEALEVPLRERNAMLLSAGFAPAYRETALDDASLDPVRGALEHVLAGHAPYPAVITDREGFVVSGNAPFRALLGPLAESPVNLARVLLSPDGLASRIRNLDEWGWHVLDGIRRKALRHPGSQLAALADELEPLVPPRRTAPQHAGFAVPLRIAAGGGAELTLLTTLAHFATTIDVAISELTLEAFLPGDAATAEHFARHPS